MRKSCLFGAFLPLILSTSVANAQANYVGLRGVVTDPHRLAIPFADVTLRSVKTGIERHVTADAHGLYELGGQLPGSYVLEAQSKGFATLRKEIELEVGQQAVLDVMLTVGPYNQTVTATAAVEFLKTADASVGEVVDQRSVSQLPLNGRMLVDLMLTVPGAHMSHGAFCGGTGVF